MREHKTEVRACQLQINEMPYSWDTDRKKGEETHEKQQQ